MPRNNFLPALEQVYDFLQERPGFRNESDFTKAVEYFRTLHEEAPEEFRVQAPSTVRGKFGNKEIINLGVMPNFTNKNKFVNWVDTQINS
ncbi:MULTISPECIES: hypothetical protein [Acinetobacter]|jgi:hypothetical protein|uniref:hypothetical protein n=1 Tax=Acinetobacter TaxID=469 RepID=UPI002004EAFE|nr:MULTISPECIES: hypothetical protein [Acinetobacter]MCK4100839.1 hypothetical protein [Acinetobacter radioresistens]MCU4499994.1 hypothetical protein [Acinetobacter radioresistens]